MSARVVSDDVLVLVSGGLDSLLAFELAVRAGPRARAVHFDTGFVPAARRARVERLRERCGERSVRALDVAQDFLQQVVVHPKHGYGAALNPCLDCRAFLLRRAGELAQEEGARWLVTGEVVGQRGFDQSRRAIALTEREAGVAGRVLRPLSAGLLAQPDGAPGLGDPPLRLHGRSRGAQLELARRLGIEDWPTPSGGCCKLAEPSFARRLRDLLEHRDAESIARQDLERLDRGRHFRLAFDLKVVVARDEEESRWLERHAGGDGLARATDGRGAVGLVEGEPDDARAQYVAALMARYAGARNGSECEIELARGGARRVLRARPAGEEMLARTRI